MKKENFYGLDKFEDVKNKVKDILMQKALFRKELWGEEAYNIVLRSILLRCIDMNWPAHIDKMSKLRDGIHLRGYANVNPLVQYQNEGFEMFNAMIQKIAQEVVLYTLRVEVQIKKKEPTENVEEEKSADNK